MRLINMPCPQTKKSNAKTPRESPKAEASADSNAAPAMTLSVRCSCILIILEAIVILLLNTPHCRQALTAPVCAHTLQEAEADATASSKGDIEIEVMDST